MVTMLAKNPRGVLAGMTCTVDSPASDDTSLIACASVNMRELQADLVNAQDVASDAWKPNLTIAPQAAYSARVKQMLLPRRRLKALKAGAPVLRAAPNKSCKAGTVSMAGKCVPVLKR